MHVIVCPGTGEDAAAAVAAAATSHSVSHHKKHADVCVVLCGAEMFKNAAANATKTG